MTSGLTSYPQAENAASRLMRSLARARSLCQTPDGPRRFFLVYDGDKPVARVMAGINERLNERLNRKCGYIASYEVPVAEGDDDVKFSATLCHIRK